jgi:hypothetical protein
LHHFRFGGNVVIWVGRKSKQMAVWAAAGTCAKGDRKF